MKALVVGLGLVGQRHVRNLKTLDPDIEVAVWRQRPDPAGWQPPKGLPVDRYIYADYDVGYWAPDAAIIANPASMHVDTAMKLAATSAHLFIEKPISDHLGRDLDLLLRVGERYSTSLMVGYDLRFYHPLQLVKNAISAGRIGRPLSIRCEVGQYLPDWRPGRDYRTSVSAQKALGGGVILELSHEIDYARWLMGEVVSVTAQTAKLSDLDIDVEDTADILLRFEGGVMGNIHLDMLDRNSVRRCRVVGTEGSIECNLLTGQTDLKTVRQWSILHEGLTVIPDMGLAEMRHFLVCCRGDAQSPVDGETGKRVLEICLAAKRSADERRAVNL